LAKKPPPEHTRWPKGVSGNPSGKKKNLLTQSEVKGIISELEQLPLVKLKAICEDEKETAIRASIASQILKSASGDSNSFNMLMDRSIGKVKETKEIILPRPTIVERMDGTKMVLSAEIPAIEGEVMGDS